MTQVREYMVPMGDGVRLYTAVLGGDSPKPLVFVRNPYCNDADATVERWLRENRNVLERGYAVVYQHCRGTGRSEGDFIPFPNERQDGLDTLEWIRRQAFYAGEIYLNGGSYLSWVHLSYLSANPPDVKAAVFLVFDPDIYRITYKNGVYKTGMFSSWYQKMYKLKGGTEKCWAGADSLRTLPPRRLPELALGEADNPVSEFMKHPDSADPFWDTPAGVSEGRAALSVAEIPILFASSHHDIFIHGMLEMWDEMRPALREKSSFIITPYCHTLQYTEDMPQAFPDGGLPEHFGDFVGEWFDHTRLGTPLTAIPQGQTAYYTLYRNDWTVAPRLADGAEARTWYLTGDGLSDAPGARGERQYLYNPYAPASFRGGLTDDFDASKLQDPPDSRQDILSFLTAPQDAPLWIRGRSAAHLTVRSDCEDTCFYLRVSIVKADGRAIGLRHDIRTLCAGGADYVPGTETELDFRFCAHSFLLEAGDRLRLDVSSSCFPYFQVHLNRKGLQRDMEYAVPAHNAVILGHGSYLTVRVAKEGE